MRACETEGAFEWRLRRAINNLAFFKLSEAQMPSSIEKRNPRLGGQASGGEKCWSRSIEAGITAGGHKNLVGERSEINSWIGKKADA